MKRNNKKGFTIVELVIVIAVIAILSAVMIPTFSGITTKAQESARDQEAKNALTNYLGTYDFTAGSMESIDGVIIIDGHYYQVTDGNIVNIGSTQTTTAIEGTVIYTNAAADGE